MVFLGLYYLWLSRSEKTENFCLLVFMCFVLGINRNKPKEIQLPCCLCFQALKTSMTEMTKNLHRDRELSLFCLVSLSWLSSLVSCFLVTQLFPLSVKALSGHCINSCAFSFVPLYCVPACLCPICFSDLCYVVFWALFAFAFNSVSPCLALRS